MTGAPSAAPGIGLCSLAGVAFGATLCPAPRPAASALRARPLPQQASRRGLSSLAFSCSRPFPPVLVHTVPALAFKAAKPDMAQKIVSGLHFRSRSLYGPGLGVEYC